jgi:hypothetical protein
MTYQVGNAAYPTANELRDQILRDLTYYGQVHGITFNVKKGSEHYATAQALANRLVVAIANNRISHDQRNPLIAEGDDLYDMARVYGIVERDASVSAGSVSVKVGGGSSVTIPAGWQATGPNGKKYVTTGAATVSNGGSVDMTSVDTGEDTELDTGDQLTWDSAAIALLLNPATVESPGIVGGEDTDDVEDIRRRFLDKLAAQAIGGNGASIKEWSEEPSAQVSAAFVYQGLMGPGSLSSCVIRDQGDRTVTGAVVDLCRQNLQAELPGGVISINLTTCSPENLDIVLGAVLPLPRSAGGAGGGWRDADPWPAALVKVTAIVGTTLTVNGSTSPIVGQSIGLWNRTDTDAPVMTERTVLTVGGSSGAWTITLDGAIGFVGVDDYVSAGASGLVQYAADVYAEFVKLGPGEKTENEDLLPRSARYPSPEVTAPYTLTAKQLAPVLDAYDELLDLTYSATYESGTTTPRTTPSIPATTSDAPKILVCRRLAIVKKV